MELEAPSSAQAGAGTIIRGGVARGFPEPHPEFPERYQEMIRARNARFEQTPIDDLLGDMTPMEFMLRFTLSHPDLHTSIVGTKNPEHFAANVAAAERGPLPDNVYAEAKRRFPPGN